MHSALSVQQCLAAKNMFVFPHASYSPDLPFCDFFFCWEWNQSCEGLISRICLKFRNTCQLALTRFKQVSIIGASSSIGNTEPIASTWKGTTLTGTTSVSKNSKHIFCYRLSLRIFWYCTGGIKFQNLSGIEYLPAHHKLLHPWDQL